MALPLFTHCLAGLTTAALSLVELEMGPNCFQTPTDAVDFILIIHVRHHNKNNCCDVKRHTSTAQGLINSPAGILIWGRVAACPV